MFFFSGANGATLHYGHAGAPNDKTVEDGDMWQVEHIIKIYIKPADVYPPLP